MYKKLNKAEMADLISLIDTNIAIGYIDDEYQTESEQFKQIKFDDGYSPYIISSFGRVFSINYHHTQNNVVQLKTTIDKDGYELIIINYNHKSYGYGIHRLVALHFIKNKNYRKYTQVNHIDTNKLNNCVWNLEWVTPKENIDHAWINGLSISIGEHNGNNVYDEKSIIKVCELLEQNVPLYTISEITGVSYPMVSIVLRKKNWCHVSDNYDFSNYKYKKRHK